MIEYTCPRCGATVDGSPFLTTCPDCGGRLERDREAGTAGSDADGDQCTTG